jgi:cohesin domain-containing protein
MLPSSRKAAVGDTLTIRVRLDHGSDVGSVPFHVTYNPQVLRFESGEEGSFLSHDGARTAFFASPMRAPGEIVVGLSRIGAGEGASGAGDLCLLRFRVISRGDAELTFNRASVKDPRDKILDSTFQSARVRAR